MIRLFRQDNGRPGQLRLLDILAPEEARERARQSGGGLLFAFFGDHPQADELLSAEELHRSLEGAAS